MAIIDFHVYERREEASSVTSTTAQTTATPSSVAVTQPLPTSVKALAGFIVVLGLIVLGVAAWKIVKWRRRKTRAASQDFAGYQSNSATVDVSQAASLKEKAEQPQVVYEPYKWVPIARPEPAHSPNKAVKKGPSRFLGFLTRTGGRKSSLPIEVVPPPAYSVKPPPSPIMIVIEGDRTSQAGSRIVSHLTLDMLQTDPHPSTPLPSPARSKSIGPDTPLYKSLASAPTLAPPSMLSKDLPRLMFVMHTFIPSLPDELAVRVGEPLIMLEEYEDEWCMVQRAGKTDTQRGVVPRFCLQERPDKPSGPPQIKPASPSH